MDRLSPDQYRAYMAIVYSKKPLTTIQGGPGTEKSSLINTISHFGSRLGLRILVTATTDLASFLINGRTVHSQLI